MTDYNKQINIYIDALIELDNITRLENNLDDDIIDVENFEYYNITDIKYDIFTELGRAYYKHTIHMNQEPIEE